MAVADDMGVFLAENGQGALGSVIFTSTKAVIPGGAGPYCVIIEYPGMPDDPTQDTDIGYEQPMVQITWRGRDPGATLAKARESRALIATIGAQDINGTWYTYAIPRQPPSDAGTDPGNSDRIMYRFNVRFHKRP
jgi:hypothetical protein